MLNEMYCHTGLLPFAQAWRELKHYKQLHLEIHSAFDGPGKCQCAAVAYAVKWAEKAPTRNDLQSRMEKVFGRRKVCDGLLGGIRSRQGPRCSQSHWVDY